jgi:hypothetical protein
MGLKKDLLSKNITDIVIRNASMAFKVAMNTEYIDGKPEEHVNRMSENFAREFSKNFPRELVIELDIYMRSMFAIYQNSKKTYDNDNTNPIRFDSIWQNTANNGFGTNNDDRPSISLYSDVLKYIEKDKT